MNYKFDNTQATLLLDLLKRRKLVTNKEAEALVHALVDIQESIEKVFLQIIPNVLKHINASDEILKDYLWDIREEFRHIDYHIHDGNLTE